MGRFGWLLFFSLFWVSGSARAVLKDSFCEMALEWPFGVSSVGLARELDLNLVVIRYRNGEGVIARRDGQYFVLNTFKSPTVSRRRLYPSDQTPGRTWRVEVSMPISNGVEWLPTVSRIAYASRVADLTVGRTAKEDAPIRASFGDLGDAAGFAQRIETLGDAAEVRGLGVHLMREGLSTWAAHEEALAPLEAQFRARVSSDLPDAVADELVRRGLAIAAQAVRDRISGGSISTVPPGFSAEHLARVEELVRNPGQIAEELVAIASEVALLVEDEGLLDQFLPRAVLPRWSAMRVLEDQARLLGWTEGIRILEDRAFEIGEEAREAILVGLRPFADPRLRHLPHGMDTHAFQMIVVARVLDREFGVGSGKAFFENFGLGGQAEEREILFRSLFDRVMTDPQGALFSKTHEWAEAIRLIFDCS